MKVVYELYIKELEDFFDPQVIFANLFSKEKMGVWLDSSRVEANLSRFSYIGDLSGPLSYVVSYDLTLKQTVVSKQQQKSSHDISIFDFLDQELKRIVVNMKQELPFNFVGGFIGYFGYELKSETAQIANKHKSMLPDAYFLFVDRFIVFDHLLKKCYLASLASGDSARETVEWIDQTKNRLYSLHPHLSKNEEAVDQYPAQAFFPQARSKGWDKFLQRDKATYLKDIKHCLECIRDGETYEVCLTNKLKIPTSIPINPYNFYSILRRINPAPYSAFLTCDDFSLACSSIERFITVDTGGNIETRPIKGTLPRGKTNSEDEKLKFQLATDEKFRAENLMIVDLLRNDLGRICEFGTIHVPHLMSIESYSTVHQLVSTIRGRLLPNISAVDCIKACFPGGSMTGAPKIQTMKILDDLETEARGIYSGAFGFLSLNGAADFNIVIRTAIITKDQLSIGIGGAVISSSDPEQEFNETLLKAESLMVSLEKYYEDIANDSNS